MPPWNNGPLTFYHGCDDRAAVSISATGVSLRFSRPLTDFGKGFYLTTYLHQAKNWAVQRCRTRGAGHRATVLRFDVDRDRLAVLQTLCFVTDGNNPPLHDYWDFVTYCRNGHSPHRVRATPAPCDYDVVFGLVSIWPQTLTLANCDQVSFHTQAALSALPPPTIVAQAPVSAPLRL